MKYFVSVLGREFVVEVDGGRVVVDGRAIEAHLSRLAGTPLRHLLLGDASCTLLLAADGRGQWRAERFGERWGDGAALEAALIQNVSRFRDPGRGQGFRQIKPFLDKWEGKISIRSGTARLAIVPAWDEDVPLSEHLPFFPGAQVQITIPAPNAEPK